MVEENEDFGPSDCTQEVRAASVPESDLSSTHLPIYIFIHFYSPFYGLVCELCLIGPTPSSSYPQGKVQPWSFRSARGYIQKDFIPFCLPSGRQSHGDVSFPGVFLTKGKPIGRGQ